jgi:hypothetical protein
VEIEKIFEGFLKQFNKSHIILPEITLIEVSCNINKHKLFVDRNLKYNINDISILFTELLYKSDANDNILFSCKIVSPIIEEISARINHTLTENKYSTYERRINICVLKSDYVNEYNTIKWRDKVDYGKSYVYCNHTSSLIERNNFLTESEKLERDFFGGNYYLHNEIYEGLIRTQNDDKTINTIQKNFKLDDNSIFSIGYGKIGIVFDNVNNYKKIISFMNNLGWFISDKDFSDREKLFLNDGLPDGFGVCFDRKFDEVVKLRKGEHLYHVTPTFYWENKISKIGLTPRAKNKLAAHPDRIYLFTKDNVEDIYNFEDILNKLFIETKNSKGEPFTDFVLLKIDTNIFYPAIEKDPHSIGVYTRENIPPNAINVIKRFKR